VDKCGVCSGRWLAGGDLGRAGSRGAAGLAAAGNWGPPGAYTGGERTDDLDAPRPLAQWGGNPWSRALWLQGCAR
jgi:hypothetical protein